MSNDFDKRVVHGGTIPSMMPELELTFQHPELRSTYDLLDDLGFTKTDVSLLAATTELP